MARVLANCTKQRRAVRAVLDRMIHVLFADWGVDSKLAKFIHIADSDFSGGRMCGEMASFCSSSPDAWRWLD